MANTGIFTGEDSRRYRDEDVEAVSKTMRGGSLSVVFGRQTIRFENEMARFVGARHAVATSSGTSALEIALDMLDVGFGDEVVVPGYTFTATVLGVLRNLAVPVFADICAETWNVTADTVEAALTSRTKAVLVAHMFGNPADVERIAALCRDRGIALIEDCAQAAGATLAGRQVGSFGAAGCFSFNEIKNLTTGEGGMLTVDDPDMAALGRVLRLHGTVDLVGVELAGKATMTEMEAALGRSQLKRLDAENSARNAFGEHLNELLAKISGIRVQKTPEGGRHVYSRYVFAVEPAAGTTRDEVAGVLADGGLAARPVYAIPLYRQPVMRQLTEGTAKRGLARSYLQAYGSDNPVTRWADEQLAVTEEFCRKQLGFIVPPGATREHAERVAGLIASAVREPDRIAATR